MDTAIKDTKVPEGQVRHPGSERVPWVEGFWHVACCSRGMILALDMKSSGFRSWMSSAVWVLQMACRKQPEGGWAQFRSWEKEIDGAQN